MGNVYFDHFFVQQFSVNFQYLTNDKRQNPDFFIINTTGGGLSFDGIKSTCC